MALTRTFGKLGRNDARIISRDTFLVTMALYLLGVMGVLRYLLPWLNDDLATRDGVNVTLSTYYPMFVAYMAVFNGALLGGMIAGFLLLEERENDTIRAMMVTPISVPTYLLYRVVSPTLYGFGLVFAQLLILSNLAPLPTWQMFVIALGSSLTASITALFFGTFAQNRVQGFALMKITGIAGLIIGGAWFVNTPLQYLFGLFPPYWVSKAYWLALDGNSWWGGALLLGIVLQVAVVWWLTGRFSATIYRET